MFLLDRWSEDGRVLRCMLGPEFLEKVPEGHINEMRPSVTDYHPWCAKPRKDNLMEHFLGVLSIRSPAWQSFYPFGDVSHSD